MSQSQSVAHWMKERDVPYEKLVERSGLEETRVRAIVMGRWTPSPDERRRVAEALELEIDDITWGHQTPIQHIYGHGPG